MSRSASATDPPERDFVLATLALCGVSFAFVWYQVGGLNQSLQLVYLNHWQNPSLYPRDPFLQTSRYYTTVLWPLLAAASRAVSLNALLLGGMVVERCVSIYAAGRIAGAVTNRSPLARLAGMIVMATGPVVLLGAGTTLPDYFEQSGAAMSLQLLAFACLLEQRYLLWGLLLGMSAELNILYAGYGLVYAAVTFAFLQRRREERPRLLAGIIIVLLCSLPLLLLLLRNVPTHQPFDHRLWWDAMMFRSAHHLLPGHWPAARYAQFGALTLLLLTITAVGGRALPGDSFVLRRVALTVALFFVTALLSACVVAYAVHVPILLQIQPIRATDFGYCVADILLAAAAAAVLEPLKNNRRRASLVPLLLLACLWPVLPVRAMLLGAAVGTAIFLLLTQLGPTGSRVAAGRRAGVACLAAALTAAIARPAMTWKYIMFNLGDRWPVSAPAAWAQQQSPTDALFLLDADDDRTEPFRALSKRSVFVHVKDGTALFYDPSYLPIWRSRMGLAGYPLPHTPQRTRPYPQWTDADALQLARSSKIDYWLVPHEHPTALPVAYQDATFKVLLLHAPTPPTTAPPAP